MALTAAAVPSAAADAKGVELYVSPSGDDSAEGTVSAPLRTLEGARNAVRKLREGGGLGQPGEGLLQRSQLPAGGDQHAAEPEGERDEKQQYGMGYAHLGCHV